MRTLDVSSVNILNKDQKSGYARIKLVRWEGTVVFDESATTWEHVSVSPFKKAIIPTWFELKKIKEIFWNDDEEVIQFFPLKGRRTNKETKTITGVFSDHNKEEFEGCRVKVLREKEDEVEVHKE